MPRTDVKGGLATAAAVSCLAGVTDQLPGGSGWITCQDKACSGGSGCKEQGGALASMLSICSLLPSCLRTARPLHTASRSSGAALLRSGSQWADPASARGQLQQAAEQGDSSRDDQRAQQAQVGEGEVECCPRPPAAEMRRCGARGGRSVGGGGHPGMAPAWHMASTFAWRCLCVRDRSSLPPAGRRLSLSSAACGFVLRVAADSVPATSRNFPPWKRDSTTGQRQPWGLHWEALVAMKARRALPLLPLLLLLAPCGLHASGPPGSGPAAGQPPAVPPPPDGAAAASGAQQQAKPRKAAQAANQTAPSNAAGAGKRVRQSLGRRPCAADDAKCIALRDHEARWSVFFACSRLLAVHVGRKLQLARQVMAGRRSCNRGPACLPICCAARAGLRCTHPSCLPHPCPPLQCDPYFINVTDK